MHGWITQAGLSPPAISIERSLRLDRENPRGVVPLKIAPQIAVGDEGLVDLFVPVVFPAVQFPGVVGMVAPGVITNHSPAIDEGVLQPIGYTEGP